MFDEQIWREEFSHRLKIIMRKKHIDQKALAELADVSEDSISRYRRCTRTPSAYVVLKLAKALECDPNDLILHN